MRVPITRRKLVLLEPLSHHHLLFIPVATAILEGGWLDLVVAGMGCPASAEMPCSGMGQASSSNDLEF